jgi:hypothetical protein
MFDDQPIFQDITRAMLYKPVDSRLSPNVEMAHTPQTLARRSHQT